MIVKERGRKAQADIGTTHPRGFDDTVRRIISHTQTVRHVLQTAGHRYIVAVRDGCTENQVLPVGIGLAHTDFTGFVAPHVINKIAEFIAIKHIILFLDHRDGHVTIVGYFGSRSALTFLRSNYDNAIGCTATIDGSGRSILQNGESLDIVRIDHRQRITHAFRSFVIDSQTIDYNQRVIRSIQRRTATYTNLRTGARGTSRSDNVHTGNFTDQHILRIVGDTFTEFIRFNSSNRTSQVIFLSAAIAHNNNFVQQFAIFY